MAPRLSSPQSQATASAKAIPAIKLAFNVDLAAIAIALALATLVRLDLLRIGW